MKRHVVEKAEDVLGDAPGPIAMESRLGSLRAVEQVLVAAIQATEVASDGFMAVDNGELDFKIGLVFCALEPIRRASSNTHGDLEVSKRNKVNVSRRILERGRGSQKS